MLTILVDVIHEKIGYQGLVGLQLSVPARIDGRIGSLLVSVRHFEEHASPSHARNVRHLTKAEFEIARLLVAEQLATGVRLADVASRIGCSAAHFSRTFHATVGVTFKRYLLQSRLSAAMKLMKESDLPLCDVASACGFGDQSAFSRAFARGIGTTPFKWRTAFREHRPEATTTPNRIGIVDARN